MIKVKIAWGSDRDENNIEEYTFQTKEEYYGFMRVASHMTTINWLDYSAIGEGETWETVEELREYYGK